MIRLVTMALLLTLAGQELRAEPVSSANKLEELVRRFEANPADAAATVQLLKELKLQGKSNETYLARYFQTQQETDYLKEQNWSIIRDFVDDVNAPQFKYVLNNHAKFIQHYSKDDVFQKLDNTFVQHLEKFYKKDQASYDLRV